MGVGGPPSLLFRQDSGTLQPGLKICGWSLQLQTGRHLRGRQPAVATTSVSQGRNVLDIPRFYTDEFLHGTGSRSA